MYKYIDRYFAFCALHLLTLSDHKYNRSHLVMMVMSITVIIIAGRQRLTGHKKGSKNLYIAALAEGVRIGCVQ